MKTAIQSNQAFLSKTGDRYYKYDNINRAVTNTSGHLISEGWKAREDDDTPHRIPDNIDTAYFDKRDRNVYFFKGDMVNETNSYVLPNIKYFLSHWQWYILPD